jgi:gliding motility-associated-like protein
MVPVKPVTLGGDAGLCPNTTLLLDAHAGYASYAWQDGTTDSILMVSEPGTYSITVTDLCSRSSSDAVVITGLPGPATPFLPADTSVCQYGGLVVVPEYSFSAYQWSTGEHTPQITIDQPGQYWLEVTNSDGCTARDTIEVGVRNCFEAFRMPNAFTPNGDGNNDVLHPVFFGPVKQFRLQVFDRWGQKVFETTQLRQGWDGRILGNPPMPRTFVWVCEYQLEGLPATWAKGTVLLIR